MTSIRATEKAKAFAAAHVAECSREILEWRRSGVLCEGRLRELGAILKVIHDYDHLQIAESIVVAEALKVVARS